ncbi:MAG TPA: anthranilate phosphoribosyltransferase [Thermoplasmata archaeon]|nr:anthranilate phosphoribosyltransferase [Thermoplasmata archaeon]HTW56400.1 anthranilate phosphoribosyltransferase [Thermoplasmata archaeon]
MIAATLTRLYDPSVISSGDARRVFDALLDPDLTEAHRAAVLAALTARPGSADELAAFAGEMRRRAVPFVVPARDRAVDVCGTGGARRPSFNVSTVSAFVVSAAGAAVVKHGNRSARGPCGSSDLLEALGLPVTSDPGLAARTYRAHRLAFLHAPLFHPAARTVAAARRLLGVPTIFNRLGPLSNPARVPYQVVGLPTPEAAAQAADVLGRLGTRGFLAMSAEAGYDEFSPSGTTRIFRSSGGRVTAGAVDARDRLPPEDRRGDWGPLPPAAAAAETERILAGGGGARRGSVLLTSGAALWISGRAPTFARGIALAQDALDDGRAERRLTEIRATAARRRGATAP